MSFIINSDGYINLNKLCKSGGKEFRRWKRLDQSKNFLKALSEELNIEQKELIKYVSGGNSERHTWGHPLVATYVAQWISTIFSVKVSLWLEEWKKNKVSNEKKYIKAITNIIPDKNNDIEKQIQLKLQKQLNGEIEVETKFGYIDLLTDTQLIEIKNGVNWKSGIGQLIVYSDLYTNHTKRLHLFNIENNSDINYICKKNNILVTYEE
jgi:hypothetical protein